MDAIDKEYIKVYYIYIFVVVVDNNMIYEAYIIDKITTPKVIMET